MLCSDQIAAVARKLELTDTAALFLDEDHVSARKYAEFSSEGAPLENKRSLKHSNKIWNMEWSTST